MQVASAAQALGNSDFCGDQVGFWVRDSVAMLCILDGLGHGREAERAAKEVLRHVDQNLDLPLETLFASADEAARDTRGAAMGLVLVDVKERSLTHVGVGNTRGLLLDADFNSFHVFQNTNGIVGAGYQKLRLETIPFKSRDLLFLYTDGFPVSATSFFQACQPAQPEELATAFMRRCALGNDDAAVLVARLETQE